MLCQSGGKKSFIRIIPVNPAASFKILSAAAGSSAYWGGASTGIVSSPGPASDGANDEGYLGAGGLGSGLSLLHMAERGQEKSNLRVSRERKRSRRNLLGRGGGSIK